MARSTGSSRGTAGTDGARGAAHRARPLDARFRARLDWRERRARPREPELETPLDEREADLLERSRNGDEAAFRLLYERTVARLKARIRARIGSQLRRKVDESDILPGRLHRRAPAAARVRAGGQGRIRQVARQDRGAARAGDAPALPRDREARHRAGSLRLRPPGDGPVPRRSHVPQPASHGVRSAGARARGPRPACPPTIATRCA